MGFPALFASSVILAFLAVLPATFAGPAGAASSSQQIPVTLFGQACLLQGPLAAEMLEAIHAVSPEQSLPTLDVNELEKSAKQLGQALGRLRAQKAVPSALDRYRERLVRRIEAQLAFAQGLQEAAKSRKPALLLSATKSHIVKGTSERRTRTKLYEALAKRLASSDSLELKEQLYETYSDLVEQDPEEEFHRAIRRLNVRYVCTYEEEETTEESGE